MGRTNERDRLGTRGDPARTVLCLSPMNFLALASAAAAATVAFSALAPAAHASQCDGTQTEVTNLVIEPAAETSCLDIELVPRGCDEVLAILVTNHCEGPVTVAAPLCPDGVATCTLAPDDEVETFPNEDPDGHVEAASEAEIEGESVDVHVAYDVEYFIGGDGEGGPVGCSVGTATGAGGGGRVAGGGAGAGAIFALVAGIFALGAARKQARRSRA